MQSQACRLVEESRIELQLSAALRRWVMMAVGPLALFVIWYAVHDQAWVTQRLLPSPVRTLQSIWSNMAHGGMGEDFGRTLWRTLQSFGIAAVLSVPF